MVTDMDPVTQWAVTTLIASAGVFGSWFLLRANREKLEADSAKLLTDGSVALWTAYRVDLEETRAELEAARLDLVGLHAEIEEQRRRRQELADQLQQALHRISRLEGFLLSLGHDPAVLNGGEN